MRQETSSKAADAERIERLHQTLRANRWDALVCALPSNVLMTSGYWPIVGTSVAVMREDGLKLLAPKDESRLARESSAGEVCEFEPHSLEAITTPAEAAREPLRALLQGAKRIGFEDRGASEPASYVAMHVYGSEMRSLLAEAAPAAELESADDALAKLRGMKTAMEVQAIRKACACAGDVFRRVSRGLKPGMTETEAAALFSEALRVAGAEGSETARAGGHVSCMSGARSGTAFGAFARSSEKRIEPGDLVLTHCNSQVNGYWTDITRTFTMGEPTGRQREMYEAIFAARAAALDTVRPGAMARDVDAAARRVLDARGFGQEFKHSTGHGVGFGAINPNAIPRIHPKSPDRLETGMVFNIEPGIYFERYGGARHCDMVALTEKGAEVLTSFQLSMEELTR